jgi:DNA-binding response OmpR family regulator
MRRRRRSGAAGRDVRHNKKIRERRVGQMMQDKKLLVIEDEVNLQKKLGDTLKNSGFDVTCTHSPQEAIRLYRLNPFWVVITDMDLPAAESAAFIASLRTIEDSPVIIALSTHNEPEWVIETMKTGVYDYIIKPFNDEDLIFKIERAYEAARLRRMERVIEKEKVIKLENQLNWLKWKDDFIKKDEDRIDRALFKSLHTNFNQGSGFGLLISLLDMIASSGKKEGDNYVIKSSLFNMILNSKKMAENVIKTFAEMNNIISNELKTTKISLDDLFSEMQIIIDAAMKYKEVRKQTVLLSDKKLYYADKFINWDRELFKQALFELLINGFKFSRELSVITVILTVDEKNLKISVISDPEPLKQGIVGIPIEYENLVFEPFFRMVNVVIDGYGTPDYGLGLTKVRKIIEKHNGSLTVSNITDHTDFSWEPVTKVCFTIAIPLEK